jgi:hypothetical protein
MSVLLQHVLPRLTREFDDINALRDDFTSRIHGMLAPDIAIYKTARLSNPVAFATAPTAPLAFINSIQSLGYFDEATLDAIIAEYPTYRDLAADFLDGIDPLTRTVYDEMPLAEFFLETERGQVACYREVC